MPHDLVRRDSVTEFALRNYIFQIIDGSDNWWREQVPGTRVNRRDQLGEYRARYTARRSVAELSSDIKNIPFPRASNVGIGLEQIFGEFLIPVILANTHDLEPMSQAIDEGTGRIDTTLTTFHDSYQRSPQLNKRLLLEESLREVFSVGGCLHKWTWSSIWKQTEVPVFVFVHPQTGQPALMPNAQSGQVEPIPADPNMPKALWPTDQATGIQLKIAKIPNIEWAIARQGPRVTIRPYEAIQFPPGTTSVDPEDWDWIADNFSVSPWWFLGREGDPFQGKLQNLDKLWRWLSLDPNTLASKPDRKLNEPVKLVEVHLKFPVTRSGRPVEVIALVAREANLLLGWRISPFKRRPFFNRQVWSRRTHPFGVGIPESIWGIRNSLDAILNQEIDAGNIYNQPPLLLSTLAMIEDEDYESTGPGTQWTVRDINGVKFLPPPISKRDTISMMSWLVSMIQRLWKVTDLNLNAPGQSLSPNVRTATGVISTLNQAQISFGHLTKRIAYTDSQEFQFVHEMFRNMMTEKRTISVDGQPVEIQPAQREEFFKENVRISAVGNGVTTNPIQRVEALTQAYQMFIASQSPFIFGDMEVRKDLEEQILQGMGLKLELKTPEILQKTQLIMQLLETPAGQATILPAVQQATQILEGQVAAGQQGQGQGQSTNGGSPNVPAQTTTQ